MTLKLAATVGLATSWPSATWTRATERRTRPAARRLATGCGVVVLANLEAMGLQSWPRLGIATGFDLAQAGRAQSGRIIG
jgi:hypothetical protein